MRSNAKRLPMEEEFMRRAIQLARNGMRAGDGGPFGAVVVRDGKIIGEGWNRVVASNDPTAHAEVLAIRAAAQALGNERLDGCELWVTLEPCAMCAGAISHARIGRVVIGCAQSRYNGNLSDALAVFEKSEAWHPCRFETGCLDHECESILGTVFKTRRKQREQAVAELANLLNLPNANKETLLELAQLGYHCPQDILNRGLEQVAADLAQRSDALKSGQALQQAAILASLCDYFNGEPVRSWKQYL